MEHLELVILYGLSRMINYLIKKTELCKLISVLKSSLGSLNIYFIRLFL